jgi:hypothetical protein
MVETNMAPVVGRNSFDPAAEQSAENVGCRRSRVRMSDGPADDVFQQRCDAHFDWYGEDQCAFGCQ